MSADFEYNALDLDSSFVATLKSLTHCEFVSGQDKVCSVRSYLAKCYQELVNIGAVGFFYFKCHSRWVQNSIHCFSAS